MNSDVNAINEYAVESLCIEIMNYCDEIGNIFDKIDYEISDLKECLSGASLSTIENSYQLIRKDYNTIKQNINNYAEDYACLIRVFKTNSNSLAALYENYIKEFNSKKNKLE